jgi:hypothetical protein
MTRRPTRADGESAVDWDPADRGQANWVGFVLLLAIAALAFTTYQVTVVPQNTAAVEFDHQQTVEGSFHEFGGAVARTARRGGTLPVTLQPGVRYPPNPLAIQPPSARGRLATTAAGPVTVAVDGTPVNVSAVCGYGTATVTTRALEYRPSYNEFDGSVVGYEHGLVYARDDGIARTSAAGLPFLAGDSLSLRPLAGERSVTSVGPVSMDLHGGPVASRTLPDGATTVTLPTRLPAEVWRTVAANESRVESVEAAGDDRVRFRLAPDSYTLTCAAVGLGEPAPSGVAPLGSRSDGADGGDGGDDASSPAPGLSMDIRDRTRGQAARFAVPYAVENVTDPTVEVTFRHPSAPDATVTRRAEGREGEVRYEGPRNSRWERDDGEVERGTPATYTITVIVHDDDGDPVAERTVTEVADGQADSPGTGEGSGEQDGG